MNTLALFDLSDDELRRRLNSANTELKASWREFDSERARLEDNGTVERKDYDHLERLHKDYLGRVGDVDQIRSEYIARLEARPVVSESTSAGRYAPRSEDMKAAATDFLRSVKGAHLGDMDAHRRLLEGAKGWVEGTDTAGGYLVPPEQLPGYLAARRASSPLRERCSVFQVRTNEVWVVTENATVTVQHVAEAATKPRHDGQRRPEGRHRVQGRRHIARLRRAARRLQRAGRGTGSSPIRGPDRHKH